MNETNETVTTLGQHEKFDHEQNQYLIASLNGTGCEIFYNKSQLESFLWAYKL